MNDKAKVFVAFEEALNILKAFSKKLVFNKLRSHSKR